MSNIPPNLQARLLPSLPLPSSLLLPEVQLRIWEHCKLPHQSLGQSLSRQRISEIFWAKGTHLVTKFFTLFSFVINVKFGIQRT